MKNIKLFAIAIATIFTIGMVSCGKEEESQEVVNLQEATITSTNPITITDLPDTMSGYPIHFKVILKDGKLVARGLTHEANVRIPSSAMFHGSTMARIVDKGDASDLAHVIGKPGMSESSDSLVDAVPGHGYIIKAWGTSNWDKDERWQNLGYHDPEPLYMRMWLKSTADDGYAVQYEIRY